MSRAAKLPGLPVVRTGNPALDRLLTAVSEHLETRQGARGDPLEQAVTLRDLEKFDKEMRTTVDAVSTAVATLRQEMSKAGEVSVDKVLDAIRELQLFKDLTSRIEQIRLTSTIPQDIEREIAKARELVGSLQYDVTVAKSDMQKAIAANVKYLTSQFNDPNTGFAKIATIRTGYYTKADTDGIVATAVQSLRATQGNKVFKQPTAPTSTDAYTLQVNDVWYDTSAVVVGGQSVPKFKPHLWDGSMWVESTDAEVDDALLKTANVSARVDTVETAKIGYCTINGVASDEVDRPACIAAGGTWNVGIPLARAVKQVAISDGASSVALEQRFTAQKDLNGQLSGQYTVKIDNNGDVSGFGLASTTNNGIPFSNFIVVANRFAITGPAGSTSIVSEVANLTGSIGESASFTGSISGNQLIASNFTGTGRLRVGAVISGQGVIVPTAITAGPIEGGPGAYALSRTYSTPILNASFTSYANNSLIVTAVTGPSGIRNGATLTGTGITAATTILSRFDGLPDTGGVGVYRLSRGISPPGLTSRAFTATLNRNASTPFVVLATADAQGNPPGVYISDAYIKNASITTAKIGDAAITNAKIGNLIASTNFNGTVDAAGAITANGSVGWAIGKAGKAVFNDVVVRGDVEATRLVADTVDAAQIRSGALGKEHGFYNPNAEASAAAGIWGNVMAVPYTPSTGRIIHGTVSWAMRQTRGRNGSEHRVRIVRSTPGVGEFFCYGGEFGTPMTSGFDGTTVSLVFFDPQPPIAPSTYFVQLKMLFSDDVASFAERTMYLREFTKTLSSFTSVPDNGSNLPQSPERTPPPGTVEP